LLAVNVDSSPPSLMATFGGGEGRIYFFQIEGIFVFFRSVFETCGFPSQRMMAGEMATNCGRQR